MLNNIETISYVPEYDSSYTYIGTVIRSDADGCFYGKVLDVDATVLYDASTKIELQQSFEAAVDNYISLLKEEKHEE